MGNFNWGPISRNDIVSSNQEDNEASKKSEEKQKNK